MRRKMFGEIRVRKIRRRALFVLCLLALAVAIAALLLTATGCSIGPTEFRDDSFTVGVSPTVVVNSENGSIEINAGTDNEVRVEATLTDAPRVQYEISQDGDTITIDAKISKEWWFFGSAAADIAITAPAGTYVDIDTSNGAVELRGMEGAGTLRTSNGKIVLKDVKGDYDGTTSNGAIEIGTMEGTCVISTSNGSVDLWDVKGEVEVESSNGEIWFSGEMTAGTRSRLVTSNGKVDVELLGTPSVSLDAKTSNGVVTCELVITATLTREDHLVGTIGAGEADLYIRTSNGDVTIR
ncbi:MAG: DUF4097 family beta strand repeat-containing protein [Dehalococcoidia bacterium]